MELLFDELTRLGMDPLTSVCVPLEVPRWLRRSTERLVTDLTATLEMMLSVGEHSPNPNQYAYVILDKDWKKMFVEVKTKPTPEADAAREEQQQLERRERRIAEEARRKEELGEEDAAPDSSSECENSASAPRGKVLYRSVPTALHLFDQFGAGRFKFLVNLIDTQWKEKQTEYMKFELERRERERSERERRRRDVDLKAWFKTLSGDKYYQLCDALRTEVPVDAQTGELHFGELSKVLGQVAEVARATRCREVWTAENIPLMRSLLEERTELECKKWFDSCQGQAYEELCAALACDDAVARVAEVVQSSGSREVFTEDYVEKLRDMRARRVEEQLGQWVSTLHAEQYGRLVEALRGGDEAATRAMQEIAQATHCREGFTREHLPRLRALQRERVEVACKKWVSNMTPAQYEHLTAVLRESDDSAKGKVAEFAEELNFGEAAVGELALLRKVARERMETECGRWFASLGGDARRRVSLLLKSEESYKEELEEDATEEVQTDGEDNTGERVKVTKLVSVKRRVLKTRDDLLILIGTQKHAPRAFHMADISVLREIYLARWLDTLESDSLTTVVSALRMPDEMAWATIRRFYPELHISQLPHLRDTQAKREAMPLATPCPSGSPFPSGSPLPSTPMQPSPQLLTPRVPDEYGENYGGEDEYRVESEQGEALAVTMYRPVSPCEVTWDVFAPPPDSELRDRQLKEAASKKKKSGPKVSKGRCSWRNVMGYLCSTMGAHANSLRMLPNAPEPNELCAVFTSQQGSEQGGGVIWVDGVTVIPDARMFLALIMCFTPHLYSLNLQVNASTGWLTQVCIGDVPCDPRGLKIDDLQRISDLRIAVSDAYLGRKRGAVVPPDPDLTPRAQAAQREHAHRVDIELDAEPVLGDAPLVREALAAMLDKLGTGNVPYAQVKPQDAIIQRNVQQQTVGSSFRILRPLHDLTHERERRIEEYASVRRKQEEDRRRKEEEKRRKEEERRRAEGEKRRKREEDKRRKQEDHRARQQMEHQQRQQRKADKKGEDRGRPSQGWGQASYSSNWNNNGAVLWVYDLSWTFLRPSLTRV